MIGKKTIELFNNQSGAANLYWPLWGCAWDWVQVLRRSNCIVGMFSGRMLIQWILPVWYFFEKHTRANKLQIEREVVGQPIQTLSTGKKVCITIQTSLLNADAAVFDDSSYPASRYLNPISFAQARKFCIIPNSTKILIMWLAGKVRHIPCSYWLPEEARWGGELCDETKTAACDTKIKLVCLFKFLS